MAEYLISGNEEVQGTVLMTFLPAQLYLAEILIATPVGVGARTMWV